jgi:Transposase C of IS166 homeodomain
LIGAGLSAHSIRTLLPKSYSAGIFTVIYTASWYNCSMRKAAALPEDVETLKSLVLERSRALEVAKALCISQKLELEKLRFQIAVLKRERYGRSSEQLDQELNQMRLSIEDLPNVAG